MLRTRPGEAVPPGGPDAKRPRHAPAAGTGADPAPAGSVERAQATCRRINSRKGQSGGIGPPTRCGPFWKAAEGRQPAELIRLNHPDDPAGCSWLVHCRGWWQATVADFEVHWKKRPKKRKQVRMGHGMDSRMVDEARFSQAYGVSYKYAGVWNKALPSSEFPVLIKMLGEVKGLMQVEEDVEVDQLSSLVNWYSQEHHMGEHSDDEKDLHGGSPVVSVSWGHPRRFWLKPIMARGRDGNAHGVVGRQRHKMVLGNGDLLIMGGACQKTHKHAVPKFTKTKDMPADHSKFSGRRINITFRNHRKGTDTGA